jgi:hypothetical protein
MICGIFLSSVRRFSGLIPYLLGIFELTFIHYGKSYPYLFFFLIIFLSSFSRYWGNSFDCDCLNFGGSDNFNFNDFFYMKIHVSFFLLLSQLIPVLILNIIAHPSGNLEGINTFFSLLTYGFLGLVHCSLWLRHLFDTKWYCLLILIGIPSSMVF